MDFYTIKTKSVKDKEEEWIEVSPDFIVGNSKDLMVRGGRFYAIWDEERQIWSTDDYDVARLVDKDLWSYAQERFEPGEYRVKSLRSFDSQSWVKFCKFVSTLANSYTQLDEKIVFSNQVPKKEDYSSKKLAYPLEAGDHSAWDELTDVLYDPEEKAKFEWGIGSIVAGDSKHIEKFFVFYGDPGSGKGTILKIIHKLFFEYTGVFEAKALGSANSPFATEAFKNNPMVGIQYDGDLSKIEDNTKLNSIIAHEEILINEKYKAGYMSHVNAMLFMGTNQPVKITDARSGIIRRLIDVNPSGRRIPKVKYLSLVKRIDFELGAIAQHCLDRYKEMGEHYYDAYRPIEMMYKTDSFFNFVEAYYDVLSKEPGVTLKQAWSLYKDYSEEARLPYTLQMNRFREELKAYYKNFDHRTTVEGQVVTSWFSEFDKTKFNVVQEVPVEIVEDVVEEPLVLDQDVSLLDEMLMHMPAQYANKHEVPSKKWADVQTTLADLNTKKLHFVKVPENHIVIDFDLKDENGEKSLEKNLAAAALWPPTYAEFSKGGAGVHLHYLYEGDVSLLDPSHSEGIEVKTLLGDASLRRRLSYCNLIPVATLRSGLKLKEKKMHSTQTIQSERALRDMIARNLRKEFNPGTKSSVDFIKHLLDEAYESGLTYDVSDMRGAVVAFANSSTNQSAQALKTVMQMKFECADDAPDVPEPAAAKDDAPLVIFDLEVYPNLFVVCWKRRGEPDDAVVRMRNPKPHQIEDLFKMKLVGYNCRRYDNHILWAAFQGYNNLALFNLSQAIIEKKDRSAMFGQAYNVSYADIYDFSSIKHSLKWWEIELGILHSELDLPWDKPVPDDRVEDVEDYCANDVNATEKVLENRWQDFVARQILAELSGLSVNDTTQNHTARIIFGSDKKPQSKFVYTDLSKDFPGYNFDLSRKPNKSEYRGEDPSEGGYVYAEPGMYENVAVLDVASMHPTSIEQLNLFGEYTPKFSALKEARVAIKRKDFDSARKMLDGRLAPFLGDEKEAQALSDALKIVINSVYGLTAASFENSFRDPRNKDNIVAKRGALFMIDLKHFVQDRGFQVVHIKTDSIKIPNATPEIIEEVMNFGAKYGYEFEHEATYSKFCLVNDAVYIAEYGWAAKEEKIGTWDAVGAQFQHPYVYKTLFTHEPIEFEDVCEAKNVMKGAMYLDFEHDRAAVLIEGMKFVGRAGLFVPVHEGYGGAMLYRVAPDNEGVLKPYAVTGTKGFLWVEADMAKTLPPEAINMNYFEGLVEDAQKQISKYGDFDWFVS